MEKDESHKKIFVHSGKEYLSGNKMQTCIGKDQTENVRG
jgi:hypothetical protein